MVGICLTDQCGASPIRKKARNEKENLETKRRDRGFSQQWVYCNTYHLIDKGNGAEAKYDLSTESHLHGWNPNLAACYFNMNLNNSYKIYKWLYNKYHPGWKVMPPLKPCINNLTHSLLQQGLKMRQRCTGAPPSATKNLDSSCSGDSQKVQSDSVRQSFPSPTATVQTGTPQTPVSGITAQALHYSQVAFNQPKNYQPGRHHISVPPVVVDDSGIDCKYKKCPGWKTGKAKRPRAYTSRYICEQCTMEKGYTFWLCHTTKLVDGIKKVVDCHTTYHVDMKLYTPSVPPGSTTECSAISDLTEE
ncbi:hypothetical protein FRACYDRAFT_246682 [Fragilariopsis cylindrus CCMP1102]|uniref:PiggyBac transposable element-derived protein domain-containing protein n=1 Tax=Fragilariopsis cylindrus CCMP1102 TaxID=635003 RepID=A0A1E7EY19_9STRA|nr:hypothetical protein FRACYDRAFT_246682 [Fragilariopsis cylindrus CCMP1102]|eukprot:OEU10812.1 hypothetical protein FRACYDRAFT_246682 [Fragilariopsis cylindrus CCMP1102]